MRKLLTVYILFLFFTCALRAQTIEILQQGKATSIRGLSVVDNGVAWVSGSKGNIGKTTDGGKTWNWQQVKGYEQADFRDIEAFSATEAVILSSGTPAVILKTTDGGATWQQKYKNDDKAYFLDAMDFENSLHGYILGDPIGGKFLVLETGDGGTTWHPFKNMPDALDGEAAFAASGTCLRVNKRGISIVTGGKQSRLLTYDHKAGKWQATNLDIKHGQDSQGAFSVSDDLKEIVGGDYAHDKNRDSVEVNWNKAQVVGQSPAGYQSCVEHVTDNTYLATGTPGSNVTTDGGRNWRQIDTTSFNVCRKAKKGTLVLLAGDKGKIGMLKF